MPNQTVSLDLPPPLFNRIEERAQRANRSIQAELLETLATVLDDSIDPKAIEQSLAVLSDADVWRAAQSRLAIEATENLEQLHLKAQREGLTDGEAEAAAALERQFERAMLVRAHAAALLKQRGHDVSSLLKS